MTFRNVLIEPSASEKAGAPRERATPAASELYASEALLAFASTDPELTALARALRSDPDLIFEWVHNTVETLPQWGSLKGPLGTFLDGCGTSIDQAELMAVLLQVAGFAPRLVVGRVTFTVEELTAWLGTDNDPSSVDAVLGSGGLSPAVTLDSNNQVASATIDWAWVQVPIGGISYVFDPARKGYLRTAGLADISVRLGYERTTFVNRALTGAVVTPTDIRNVNRANIRTDIGAYANTLFLNLLNNLPDAGPDDVLGGASIIAIPINTRRRDTSDWPYATRSADYPDVPASLRTRLTVTLPGASAITFDSSAIYGRRLSLFFDGAVRPVLALDGSPQRTGAPAQVGSLVSVGFAIDHPYPSGAADEAGSQAVRASAGGAFVISNGWGPVGRATIERHRRILEANTAANPTNPGAEPVLGESLLMLGFTWLAQVARAQRIVDALGRTYTLYHHGVGIVGMEAVVPPTTITGPYVDLPFNTLSVIQRIGRPANLVGFTPQETAAFFVLTELSSVLESGSIEQTQPGVSAVSTVKLLDLANQNAARKIFDIPNVSVFDQVRSQLVNYNAAVLDQIRSDVNAGFRAILPEDGGLIVNQWTGYGYFSVRIQPSSISIGALISGRLSGGFPTVNQPPPVVNLNAGLQLTPPSLSAANLIPGTRSGDSFGVRPVGGDPLNLPTGDYIYSVDDLTVGNGGFPYTLTFQRTYDSGRASAGGALGPGWRHGLDLFAVMDSDGFEAMAATSPRNGVFSIAAVFVMLDLLNTSTTIALDRIVISTLVAQQWMELLTNNVFRISRTGAIETFVRTGTARWSPPIGSSSALTVGPSNVCTLATGEGELLQFAPANPGQQGQAAQPGRITRWESAAGARVDFSYSGPNLTAATSNLGRTIGFTYTNGLLTSVTDGNGRSVGLVYVSGRLDRVTDPLGQVTRYAYDAKGRLTQIFYPAFPNDAFVTNVYDDVLGTVTEQRDASGRLTTVYVAGRRTELEEPSGNRHAWYFDPLGKALLDVQDYGFNASGVLRGNFVTATRYDGQSRPQEVILPEGNRTTTVYDRFSRPLTITRHPKPGSPLAPLVQTIAYTGPLAGRDNFRRVAQSTDPRGNVTVNEIETSTGNLLRVTQPAVSRGTGTAPVSPVTRYTYTPLGLLESETDAEGRVTRHQYDATGNMISRTVDDGAGRLNLRTTWTYDAVGNALSVVTPRGNVAGGTPATFTTVSTYDAKRRLVSVAPNGFQILTQYSYDADDRVTEVRRLLAPAGGGSPAVFQTTRTSYTRSGKVLAVIDAAGVGVTNSYDGADRLRFATSTSGRRVVYDYDVLSRVVRVREDVFGSLDPSIVSRGAVERERRGYTRNGLLASLRDGEGNTTGFVYDGYDRLAETQYPGTPRERYGYDANGNQVRRTTRAGLEITSVYDALDRLVTRSVPANAHAPAVSYSYGYDLTGLRLDARRSLDAAGLAFVYDTAGRLTAETDAAGRALSYAYDADGNRISLTWPVSGTQSFLATWDYDAIGRVVRIFEAGQRVVAYGYDLLSRRTSQLYHNLTTANWAWQLNDTLGGVVHQFAGGSRVVWGYQHNRENAVRTRTVSDGAYLPGAGNPALVPGTRDYVANALNQYATVAGTGYSYDQDGNLAGDGVWSYGHDAEGRLVSATRAGVALAYGYDALGRRRSRTVNGARTEYLLSGDQEVGEYNASGALLRRFLWGPAGPDDIVALMGATGGVAARRRFHHLDGLGSTVALTDSTGAVVERYPATAFGVGDATTGITPWRFTGRRLDPETGFYHLRARDYAPMIGRFVQPDPIGMAGGVNLYAYVGNDPLNRTDPSGLVGLPGFLIGAGSGAIAGGYAGGWRGALIGAAVGGLVGLGAPAAALAVGRQISSSSGAAAARALTFTGVNITGAVASTIATNLATGRDVSEGLGTSVLIGALAPLVSLEVGLVAAGGAIAASRGIFPRIVDDVFSAQSGLFSSFASAADVLSQRQSSPVLPYNAGSIAGLLASGLARTESAGPALTGSTVPDSSIYIGAGAFGRKW
jgi:RHS repeat-associated protein